MKSKRRAKKPIPPAKAAIQFKIALRYIKPPTWRRILVPDNFTLAQLHEVIQIAMGWENHHLHAFRIGGIHYSDSHAASMDMNMENEEVVFLSQIVSEPKQKFYYEYDFGDSWGHDVIVEKILPFEPEAKYPRCLAGKRACPPEDCGSVPGYYNILEILQDESRSEDDEELLEWLGDYDPEHFGLEEVNAELIC